jgi:prepilin-type processing-associated H-X9-DG protein
MRQYYVDLKLLQCPDDLKGLSSLVYTNEPAEMTPRSYIINGWNDYFEETLNSTNDLEMFYAWQYPGQMPELAVTWPTDTLLFGEKTTDYRSFHMDFLQKNGDDIQAIEESRHVRGGRKTGGGSIYAYVDGHADFRKAGTVHTPINLWAVTPKWRSITANPNNQ